MNARKVSIYSGVTLNDCSRTKQLVGDYMERDSEFPLFRVEPGYKERERMAKCLLGITTDH